MRSIRIERTVVGSILLATNQHLRVEKRTVVTGADFIDGLDTSAVKSKLLILEG